MTRRRAWLFLGFTLALQLALQAYFFPVGELFTAKPLYYIDSSFHQYEMEVAGELCQDHQMVGYDPYFSAGYLGGVPFNASAKIPALMNCLVGGPASVAPIYKAFSFVAGVLGPVAPVLAAVLLEFDVLATVFVAIFALLSWWTGPMRWYHTAGLVSYVLAAYWTLPFAAAMRRCGQALRPVQVLGLGAGAAVGTLVHPLFVVTAALTSVPLLLESTKTAVAWKRLGWLCLVVACAVLALNGGWFVDTMSGQNFSNVSQPYQRLVDPWLFLHEALGRARTASGGSRLDLALVLGAFAAWRLSSGASRRLILALIAAGALAMAWASLGGLNNGIAALQPNRISALAWLTLSLPAAWGVSALCRTWQTAQAASRAVAGVGLLLIFGVVAFFARDAGLEIFSQRTARYAVANPEVKGEGALSPVLVDWVRTHTDDSARIYFETSLGRVHDHAHMAGIYVLQTRREFIGGPYPFTDFASAWDGYAFGSSLETLTPADLGRYLDLYNVKWMLCHSAACRAAMRALPLTDQVADFGSGVVAFMRNMTPNYFVSGSGQVNARCINRVDFASVKPDEHGEVLLKYHWVPGLRTEPAMPIQKRWQLNDPRPFALLTAPVERFSLGVGTLTAACPK